MSMTKKLVLVILVTALVIAGGLALHFLESGLINWQGLLLVFGGTLLASMIGHSPRPVLQLLRRLPEFFRASATTDSPRLSGQDYKAFLQVSDWHRRGNPRNAERIAQTIRQPFLRKGTLLALDPHNSEELPRMLQWRIRQQKETDAQDIRILRTMATFAPAFGMLGTLLGLLALLGNISQTNLEYVGVAMGFALMSTLYGLVLANLVFRPLALKLEERARQHMMQMNVLMDAITMLFERQHPALISEYLTALRPMNLKTVPVATTQATPPPQAAAQPQSPQHLAAAARRRGAAPGTQNTQAHRSFQSLRVRA